MEDEDGNVHFSEYVFHQNRLPVGDFRKAWKTACAKSGISGRLFHDLRRSAGRNLIASGVHRVVAMKITGHKTDAMFRRYAIVNEDQKRDALSKTQAFVARPRRLAKWFLSSQHENTDNLGNKKGHSRSHLSNLFVLWSFLVAGGGFEPPTFGL